MGCLVNAREQPQHGLPLFWISWTPCPCSPTSYSDVAQAGPAQTMLESF